MNTDTLESHVENRARAATRGVKSGAGEVALRRGRVLVIEDDMDARFALQIQLQATGCEVVLHGDGRNAISMIQKLDPDVIVLDLGLPGLDGLEVLRRLKLVDSSAVGRVVVVSARDEELTKRRVLELGARHYFQKPVPIQALRRIVDRAILSVR